MSIVSKCKHILNGELNQPTAPGLDGVELRKQISKVETIRELMHVYLGDMRGDIDGFITLLERAETMPSSSNDYKFPYWE